MKTVIQRVKKGMLCVGKEPRGEIGSGLVVLVAVEKGDTEKDCEFLAGKILSMRIFENSSGKMDYSLMDIKGGIIVISQFTLCANCRRGNRPDFTEAESPDKAVVLYDKFVELIKKSAAKTVQGEFGKYMLVEIHNDGPVTIILNSR
ncbi:MAG TPA: D-aminoacyl-tRNA deacylase [bacterium]|nr:D-aminoacyl-tRNA deacylase [bacterium]